MNTGDDCFVNTTVQILRALPRFAETLITETANHAINMDIPQLDTCEELRRLLKANGRHSVSSFLVSSPTNALFSRHRISVKCSVRSTTRQQISPLDNRMWESSWNFSSPMLFRMFISSSSTMSSLGRVPSEIRTATGLADFIWTFLIRLLIPGKPNREASYERDLCDRYQRKDR